MPNPFLQVVSVAATFCEVWEAVCSVLAELDVLVAFADLCTAAPKPYVRPTMLPASGEGGAMHRSVCQLAPSRAFGSGAGAYMGLKRGREGVLPHYPFRSPTS